jgi:serine/threonine protein kinase
MISQQMPPGQALMGLAAGLPLGEPAAGNDDGDDHQQVAWQDYGVVRGSWRPSVAWRDGWVDGGVGRGVEVTMTPDPAIGTVVAGYRILAPVSRGGMGVVYRAEEVGLGGRPVALKLLSPALAGDPAFRERFLREMRVAAAIDHPNIVPVYRAGDEQGRLYIAMRYVDALDLRRVLHAEGRLTAGRTIVVLEQVARALDAAHARGLVHRDVKPGNILLLPPATQEDVEHVYLVDFGLARSASDDLSISGAGLFVGTPRYAAPEQVAGQPVDGRTDGYALGCVLYECLTGRPPFPAGSNEALLFAHLEAAPPQVTAERPELPTAIDRVVQRAMTKAKQDRFTSCRELIAAARGALAPALTGGSVPTQILPSAPPTPSSAPARPAPPAAAAQGYPSGPSQSHPAVDLVAYQPLHRPARRARLALWVAMVIAVASAFANLDDSWLAGLVEGRAPEPGSVSGFALGVGLVQAVWFLVSAALFLAWFRRAYTNLASLGARRPRYGRGWTIGAWVLPVFSLFRPKQLLNDIWRASDPDLPPDMGDRWRHRPVSPLLAWWWLTFLASILVRSITTEAVHVVASVMTLGLLPSQLDRFQASADVQVLADLLTVLAGLLALGVVRRTTTRQEQRAARLAGSSAPTAWAAWRGAGWPGWPASG